MFAFTIFSKVFEKKKKNSKVCGNCIGDFLFLNFFKSVQIQNKDMHLFKQV